jgi:hypothetical protein
LTARESFSRAQDSSREQTQHRCTRWKSGLAAFNRNGGARWRSRGEPSALVDIELYQALVAHFQKQRLASFLVWEIGALHDFVGLERLLAKRIQDILTVFQHDFPQQTQELTLSVE